MDVIPSVEAEVDRIQRLNKNELRILWRQTFKSEPPKAFGPDLLKRSLAYRVQEVAYGGLSASTKRLLDQLVKTVMLKPDERLEMPRRVKPGGVLVREWKGVSHRVMVLEDGFAYEGKTYPSLSEIARQITGTRWNGPKFFGLRASPAVAPTEPAQHRGRGRPAKIGTARKTGSFRASARKSPPPSARGVR